MKKVFSVYRLFLLFIFSLLLLSVESSAQCTSERIFLPIADTARYSSFGENIDVSGEYMVASAYQNDSLQAYAGIAFVYKLNSDNKWMKIAALTPSDPGKYGYFGFDVAIYNNTIVVFGREYNHDGRAKGKLYVYEKPAGSEWTSATEDYTIAKDFGNGFGNIALHGDELIALSWENGQSDLETYKKVSGKFSLSQAIILPQQTNIGAYETKLAVSDNFIAIGSAAYLNSDLSAGAVFVYEKINGTYKATPAVLTTSEKTYLIYQNFASAFAVTNSTIIVTGLECSNNSCNQLYYVFERPSGGWVNAAQAHILSSPGYAYYDVQMAASDEYFFCTGPAFKSIVGFRKPSGGWSTNATSFVFNDVPAEKVLLGYQIKLNSNHIIIGASGRYVDKGTADEFIADYYSPTAVWEDPSLKKNQIIHAYHIDATDDLFGQSIGIYNNQLAVCAAGDDKLGSETGVVYVFDTNKQSNNPTPDQLIYNPEDENYTGFGHSIAMGDSLMFISAPNKDSIGTNNVAQFYDIGKVYIYRLTSSGWKYSSQIIAPEIHDEVYFGQNVVWSPGYVAVTEYYAGNSSTVGLVHVYKENAFHKFDYIATLHHKGHSTFDYFGLSMVMTDSIIVIGGGTEDINYANRARVYIFRKKGEWKNATEDARLYVKGSDTDNRSGDGFGVSVSMYGEYIVIGASNSPGFDRRPIPRDYIISGAAYIYKQPKGGWKGDLTETAKLMPSDPTDFGTFGTAVVIDHDDIFIGSPNVYGQYNYLYMIPNNDPTLKPGKIYHYIMPQGGWVSTNQEHDQFQSFSPDPLDSYGAVIYISDRSLYLGVMLDNTTSGYRTGSVQTTRLPPAIDVASAFCADQTPIVLRGSPKGGQWSGDGVDPNNSIFDPAVAGPGRHTVTYDLAGCKLSAIVEVEPGTINILSQSPDLQKKCIGNDVSLAFQSDQNAANYKWYFSNTAQGPFVKIDSMQETITTTAPGYYEVTISRQICPSLHHDFTVVDDEKISIDINPVPIICDKSPVQLVVSPTTGSWSGTGISSDGKFNPAGLADGFYRERYEVVTPIGCHWKDSVKVRVDILKQPSMIYSGEKICGNKPVTISLGNTDNHSTIVWYDGDGNEIPTENQSSLQIRKEGTYSASVSKWTCRMDLSSVTVLAEKDSLFVPNVFTPNNDTFNDYFEIHAEGIDHLHLSVCNRYGKLVYETSDPSFRWLAEDVSSGVYFWRVTYTTCADISVEKKRVGTSHQVTLNRHASLFRPSN